MTVQKVLLLGVVLVYIGADNVFGENERKVPRDYRHHQMEFTGYAKPLTDKFLRDINTNSEAFQELFSLANFQPLADTELDEQDTAFQHCRATHRSQATELLLETSLIFQSTCLDAIQDLGPSVDKTVSAFLAEVKKASEDAHKQAVGCSAGSEGDSQKGPEHLIECLREVLDANDLSLHSYLDELSVLYAQMSEVIRKMEICERQVVDIVESKIADLVEDKIMKGCVYRKQTIEFYFKTLAEDWESSVTAAVEFYGSTISAQREGLKDQMDVVLTRRPLRKMIRVIGKLLENEAAKLSESTQKRIDAIDDLDEKFDACTLQIADKIRSLLDESVAELAHCGASVSKLQYEFDFGLASLAEEAVTVFRSVNKEALQEACGQFSEDSTQLEVEVALDCVEKDLISKISDVIVPLERSVAEFLYEELLKYTNMEAHLTVKECIGGITKKVDEDSAKYMQDIHECVVGNNGNKQDDKEEL